MENNKQTYPSFERKNIDLIPFDDTPLIENKNNTILDIGVWIPDLNPEFFKKCDKEFGKLKKEMNPDKINNWQKTLNILGINDKNNFDQLKEILGRVEYASIGYKSPIKNSSTNKKSFLAWLMIDLWIYKLEWNDDIKHMFSAAVLLDKSDFLWELWYDSLWELWKDFIMNKSRAKETDTDNPKKQKLIHLIVEKIKQLKLIEINKIEAKNKLILDINSDIKLLPKGTIQAVINDSIHDMESNIMWIVLKEYLDINEDKTIVDFFKDFKNSKTGLQEKFKKYNKKYWLTKEDLKIEEFEGDEKILMEYRKSQKK